MGMWLVLMCQTGHLCHPAGSCIRTFEGLIIEALIVLSSEKLGIMHCQQKKSSNRTINFIHSFYTVLLTCAVGSLHSKYTNNKIVRCQYDRNAKIAK